jgi:hypothetical protein
MKTIYKILIFIAAFVSLATLSTLLFFYNKIPSEAEIQKEFHDEQTPLSRVQKSNVFSKFENFNGINNLTQEQKDSVALTLKNVESVLKDLRNLEDNTYRIDICAQLENKIQDYSIKTPGLSYFFRGSYEQSASRERHVLGEIYSAPWFYIARYDAFREMFKVIADAYYSILWEGKNLNISKKDVLILGSKITAQASYYHEEIVTAIDKAHHLLKMIRLIKYQKDNKYNNDIRDYCASVEESLNEENGFDYKGEYQNLLEIYNAKEVDFLTAEERKGVDLSFELNFGWLRPKIKETFNTKKEKIIDSIESDINK